LRLVDQPFKTARGIRVLSLAAQLRRHNPNGCGSRKNPLRCCGPSVCCFWQWSRLFRTSGVSNRRCGVATLTIRGWAPSCAPIFRLRHESNVMRTRFIHLTSHCLTLAGLLLAAPRVGHADLTDLFQPGLPDWVSSMASDAGPSDCWGPVDCTSTPTTTASSLLGEFRSPVDPIVW
jgi:hypothetical protein